MSETLQRLSLHMQRAVQGEVTIARSDGAEPWSFTYSIDASCDAALTMPRTLHTHSWNGILPAFEQHLPEMDLGLFPLAIWKLITRDSAGLLWVAGQRRLGRLRFTRPGESLPPVAASGLTAADIARATHGDSLLADLLSRMTSLPGVSGVQPKLLLPLMEHGSEPPRALADTHLLKGNRPEYAYATTVEAATLTLAHACGLPVPPRTLSADGRLLAVERFDLDAQGEPLGFDEACSLMGLWARDKYLPSCEQLHKALLAFIPPAERLAFTRQFFTLLAFNLLIENGDAHCKNFGLLYEQANAAGLAPVYDVLTTTCFEGLQRDVPALSLAGRKVWGDWQGFARVAVARGLRPVEVRQLLTELGETLAAQMRLTAKFSDQVPAAAPLLLRMHDIWQRSLVRLQTYLMTR